MSGPQKTSSFDSWEALHRRNYIVSQAVRFQGVVETASYARAIAYLPAIQPEPGKRHRFPRFWGDLEVRRAIIEGHRQSTLDQAFRVLLDRFGSERAPSRSALHRAWQKLDKIRETH